MNVKAIVLTACVLFSLGCSKTPEPDAAPVAVSEPKTLVDAIKDDRPEAVQKLLAAGAKVNEVNDKGETPLHLAAEDSRLNIARILVEAGADVNAKTNEGSTPLGYSISYGRGNLVPFLVQHGANVNTSSPQEWTPLHWAIGTQNDDLVKSLLDGGADANAKDLGLPIIFTAVQYGTLNAVKMLVAHGANPNARSAHDGTTLLFAAIWDGTGMVDGLLKLGTDINAKDFSGQTVLDFALSHQHDPKLDQQYPRFRATIELLKARGAKTSKTKFKNSGIS